MENLRQVGPWGRLDTRMCQQKLNNCTGRIIVQFGVFGSEINIEHLLLQNGTLWADFGVRNQYCTLFGDQKSNNRTPEVKIGV